MIRDIAAQHGSAPFRLGYFYSEVDKECVRSAIRSGEPSRAWTAALRSPAELDATDRIVAHGRRASLHKLLDMGADVIIGGRSSDCAIFAAPATAQGCSEADAYYLGKVLECASFCAEPYGAKETVLGAITARA